MRYSMGFAGALLLAMSTSLMAVDAVRDAGSKVRGEWLGAPAASVNVNQGFVYRAYSVAPSAPAPVMQAAPAPAPAPQVAQSNGAVRSFSYAPAPTTVYSANRTAPYLRADHKILGQYGD
jgi:hypothetical protein